MNEQSEYSGRGGWRGGGRPKGSGTGRQKTAKLTITCTPEEKLEAERRAAEHGQNVSRWALGRLFER